MKCSCCLLRKNITKIVLMTCHFYWIINGILSSIKRQFIYIYNIFSLKSAISCQTICFIVQGIHIVGNILHWFGGKKFLVKLICNLHSMISDNLIICNEVCLFKSVAVFHKLLLILYNIYETFDMFCWSSSIFRKMDFISTIPSDSYPSLN